VHHESSCLGSLPRLMAEVRLRPAVGMKNIEVAVVVDIDDACAPAPGTVGNAEPVRVVDKDGGAAVVDVQAVPDRRDVVVARPRDARDEPVEITVVVDVPDCRAHPVLDAPQDGRVEAAKGAVTVVEGELSR